MKPPPRQRLIHTPRLDAWRERLRSALEPHGAKTDLASHMARERGQQIQTWKVNISRVLHHDHNLNSEDLLAISAWLESRPGPRPRSGRPVKN